MSAQESAERLTKLVKNKGWHFIQVVDPKLAEKEAALKRAAAEERRRMEEAELARKREELAKIERAVRDCPGLVAHCCGTVEGWCVCGGGG